MVHEAVEVAIADTLIKEECTVEREGRESRGEVCFYACVMMRLVGIGK